MKKTIILILIFLFSACTTGYQASNTDKGAAAGAVVGGGVGAIVGNQAGSTTGGLALGAITGAGVGAYIGNNMQDGGDPEQQRETILKQQRKIQKQQNEIDELRMQVQDQVAYKDPMQPEIQEKNIMQQPQIGEVKAMDPKARAAYDWQEKALSAECEEAMGESQQAENTQEIAEKLYHYRRALRLCPENPDFHVGISSVYMELERFDDARFELQEALKLDPDHAMASQMMNQL